MARVITKLIAVATAIGFVVGVAANYKSLFLDGEPVDNRFQLKAEEIHNHFYIDRNGLDEDADGLHESQSSIGLMRQHVQCMSCLDEFNRDPELRDSKLNPLLVCRCER